jgi:hypothetical protein
VKALTCWDQSQCTDDRTLEGSGLLLKEWAEAWLTIDQHWTGLPDFQHCPSQNAFRLFSASSQSVSGTRGVVVQRAIAVLPARQTVRRSEMHSFRVWVVFSAACKGCAQSASYERQFEALFNALPGTDRERAPAGGAKNACFTRSSNPCVDGLRFHKHQTNVIRTRS